MKSFTPDNATRLSASTKYWLVLKARRDSGVVRIGRTDSHDEDPGYAQGWSIANEHVGSSDNGATWNIRLTTIVVRIAVKGEVVVKSSDATLSALALTDASDNAVAFSPAFASATTSYSATVANSVSRIKVQPTANDSYATIEYLGDNDATLTDADTDSAVFDFDPDVGSNIIKVKVTAEDGTTTETYTVTVTRQAASTDARLSALALADASDNAVALSPAFTSATTSYTATVARSVSQIKVQPTANDSYATIEYLNDNDATLTDADTDSAVFDFDLDVGSNVVKVKVTAEDGTTTETYTVTVTRQAALPTDATLSALALTAASNNAVALSPAFASATTSYTATVGRSVSQIKVQPTANNSYATIEYLNDSDATLTDADTNTAVFDFDLDVGSNIIKVKVTAEDGTTTETYTVTVTRQAVSSTDATLSALALTDARDNAVALSPAFASAITSYTATVGRSVSQIKVQPTNDSYATIEYLNDNDATLTDADTNTAVFDFDLDVGSNIIKVKVTAEDGTTTETYTVTVTRQAVSSTDATLSALALTDASDNAITLDPTFASGVEDYTASVANAITQIKVRLTANDSYATIEYLNDNDATLTDADTDTAVFDFDLIEGANIIKVKVTAEDGTTIKTYEVTVTRVDFLVSNIAQTDRTEFDTISHKGLACAAIHNRHPSQRLHSLSGRIQFQNIRVRNFLTFHFTKPRKAERSTYRATRLLIFFPEALQQRANTASLR